MAGNQKVKFGGLAEAAISSSFSSFTLLRFEKYKKMCQSRERSASHQRVTSTPCLDKERTDSILAVTLTNLENF